MKRGGRGQKGQGEALKESADQKPEKTANSFTDLGGEVIVSPLNAKLTINTE
jgi:hypothetical protein